MYIVYMKFSLCNILHSIQIYIGRSFLKDCFYCYSLTQRVPEQDMTFFIDAIICQHFLQETYIFLSFVRLETLALHFLCFLDLYDFPFSIGIIFNVLLHFGLRAGKLCCSFFITIFVCIHKFAL